MAIDTTPWTHRRLRWIAALLCTLCAACGAGSHAGDSPVDVAEDFVGALLAGEVDAALAHTSTADREVWTVQALRRLARLDDPLQVAYRSACELEEARLAPHDVVRVHWRCPDPLWLEGRLLELGDGELAGTAKHLPALLSDDGTPWIRQSLDVNLVREEGHWRVTIGAHETAEQLADSTSRDASVTASPPGLPHL